MAVTYSIPRNKKSSKKNEDETRVVFCVRVKKRTFSGCVCEQEVFTVGDGTKKIKGAVPRPRFKTDAERERHRRQQAKRQNARAVNENFSPTSLYSTLTFDRDNEVHEMAEAERIAANFIKSIKRKYQEVKIRLYLGQGKHTHRIHCHMLSDGVPAEVIAQKWKYGTVLRIEHLRKDNYYNGINHGQDYTGLADYLFEHWAPGRGGHCCRYTRNAIAPPGEDTKEIKRTYTEQKPPTPPKGFVLVESKASEFGYLYFKYVKKVENPTKRRRKNE